MSAATTVTNFTPASETPPPGSLKSKTQEAIQQATAALIAKLEAGHTDAMTDYLKTMAKFRKYSFGNCMLIARQAPHASHVAGFHAWLKFSRYVKKGEKGIAILAPLIVKNDRKGVPLERGPRMVGCRIVYVFDVSQTDGEPLPEVCAGDVQGDPGEYTARLLAFCARQGITVELDAEIEPALGLSYGGKIQIAAQPAAEVFATLVHETAHELLHKSERRQETSKEVRETEAEATAFIVSQSIGLDCANKSAEYIQLYNGDAATLAESLKHVLTAAREILAAIDGEETEEGQ